MAAISIHALLAESDNGTVVNNPKYLEFLSTLSLRRATSKILRDEFPTLNFYPRSPCGERQSSPAPLPKHKNFYPRSPCGERLISDAPSSAPYAISIHALLAESDKYCLHAAHLLIKISIHALLAESDADLDGPGSGHPVFLSTLSLRRATTT